MYHVHAIPMVIRVSQAWAIVQADVSGAYYGDYHAFSLIRKFHCSVCDLWPDRLALTTPYQADWRHPEVCAVCRPVY